MATLYVRDLDPDLKREIKAIAARKGWTMLEMVTSIFRQAVSEERISRGAGRWEQGQWKPSHEKGR